MKLHVSALLAAAQLLAVPFAGVAQEKKADAAAAWPAANPKDVESLDAILAAVYDVISGPAVDRDWNRFLSLSVPEGRLVPIRKNADGSFKHQFLQWTTT